MAMNVIVNGQPTQARHGQSIRELIEQLGMGRRPVAVEVNQEVVPHRQHGRVRLNDGDCIEIVTLVGGG